MSIENCPLSQIPTEIVAGGPSLVIQVQIGRQFECFCSGSSFNEIFLFILEFHFIISFFHFSLQKMLRKSSSFLMTKKDYELGCFV